MSITRLVLVVAAAGFLGCFTKPPDVDFDASPNDGPDAAIDGAPGTYHVGGTVAGMWDGAAVSLRLEATGVDEIKTVSSDTGFSFDMTLPMNTDYTVTVATQPTSHTCTVQSGTGTVASADVTDVQITCTGPAVAIALSAPIDWAFDANTLSYPLQSSVVIQQTTFTVTSSDATAITLDGTTAMTSGVASTPIPLSFGPNNMSVRVDVGSMTRTYAISIDRGAVPVAQYVYAKASNTDAGDNFGQSVAISGDTMVVGALQEGSIDGTQPNNGGAGAGAAYVFRRTGSTWTQEAYLKASSIDAGDEFGLSVAISGDTIAIGAPREDSAATGIGGNANDDTAADAGAVYVFHRSGTTWSLQAYVKGSNTEAGDNFGKAIALENDTMAVGADEESSCSTGINGDQTSNACGGAGAVYVFTRSGVTWSQQAFVKSSNARSGQRLGIRLALSVNTLVAGTLFESSCSTGVNGNQNDTACSDAGAAYVFVRNGSTWAQQAYVKASNTQMTDEFGQSVAVVGDVLVVGAQGEDSGSVTNQGDNSQSAAGAVYVFRRSGTTWTQEAYLKEPQPLTGHDFGGGVSLAGDVIAVDAFGETPGGEVHLFRYNGTSWGFDETVHASNAESTDQQAGYVALTLDSLGMGAGFEDSLATGVNPTDTGNGPAGSTTNSGAAYLFR